MKIRLLIFGAGENAKKIMNCLKTDTEIVAFVDNDNSKWGTEMFGKAIIEPDEIKSQKYDFIIVAVIRYQEIVTQLVKLDVDVSQIVTPFAYEHKAYEQWRKFFNIEELIYLEMNQKIEKLSTYINNLEYELASKIEKNKIKYPKILSWKKAIDEIINNQKSMSRFGDGEFDLVLGRTNSFQSCNENLAIRLKEVLVSNLDNHIVGIPDAYGDFVGRTDEFIACFRNHFRDGGREREYELLDMEKEYYDSFITRPYKDYLDKSDAGEKFELLKSIWQGRDLTIVEGKKTRLGVGNDLFSNAKSCIRILAPCTEAYSKYDEVLKAVLKTEKDRLVLIALGATATVLAYDLAKQGYQALDIGHVDIEYEWFLRGADSGTVIEGKYVNEIPGGKNVPEYYEDEKYNNEIVEVIG